MLKDIDKYESYSHFKNKDIKKKNIGPQKENQDIKIFVSVFFVGLLIILGLAKLFSPNVEIGIASNGYDTTFDEREDMSHSLSTVVDDRLKKLKMEDDGTKAIDETMFSPELDEKVILPKQKKMTVGQMEAENNINSGQETQTNQQQVAKKQEEPVQQKQAEPQMPDKIINARVVVGSYATEKQAEVAKSIIQDAGLNVTPVVKNIGGYYTLQVGSYSSKERAQDAANNLLKNNFPAKVILN